MPFSPGNLPLHIAYRTSQPSAYATARAGRLRSYRPAVATGIMGFMDDRDEAIVVAVPPDAVADLESMGLAFPRPVLRGAALEAVVTVGTDAATLVSLLQAPDAIRAFAAWVRGRCVRSGDSIELSARSGDLRVHLKVYGHTDASRIVEFLMGVLEGDKSRDRSA